VIGDAYKYDKTDGAHEGLATSTPDLGATLATPAISATVTTDTSPIAAPAPVITPTGLPGPPPDLPPPVYDPVTLEFVYRRGSTTPAPATTAAATTATAPSTTTAPPLIRRNRPSPPPINTQTERLLDPTDERTRPEFDTGNFGESAIHAPPSPPASAHPINTTAVQVIPK
jgi:hypothetical protein